MRFGCLLPLIALGLIIGGGQSVFTSIKNRKVTEVEIASLASSKPDAKWLRIKGGELDTMNSTYTSAFGVGKASEIYVPLVAPGVDSSTGTIQVLVLTKDPDLLKFTNDSRKLEDEKVSEEKAMAFLLESQKFLRVARDVEGLVQYGIDGGGKKERKIRALYPNLSNDLIIIEEGSKPSMLGGFVMLLVGLGLGVLLLLFSGKKTEAA